MPSSYSFLGMKHGETFRQTSCSITMLLELLEVRLVAVTLKCVNSLVFEVLEPCNTPYLKSPLSFGGHCVEYMVEFRGCTTKLSVQREQRRGCV
jgi:hypothetical protein